jgi:His-Xaa-Ser system protein HxsD
VEQSVGTITISVDSRLYSIDVVQRAAFRCTDWASFQFSVGSDTVLIVTATVKPSIGIADREIESRFHNELLDQQLRQRVAAETKTERDLILAYAFSNTKLLG